MANKEHLELLNQDVEEWNKWRAENDEIKPDLSGAALAKSNLTKANLNKTNLNRATLSFAYLIETNLREANLKEAILNEANLSRADLSGANLSEANLIEANLIAANLKGAILNGANLNKADLGRALLTKANLDDANLNDAKLNDATLIETKLRGANLSGADLSRTDLFKADLIDADLSRGFLFEANLRAANLYRANLCNANLKRAIFNSSDLTMANLTKADLQGAFFVETKLEGADLSNSKIFGISAWDLKTNKDTNQLDLVITKDSEPIVTVDDMEVAQFIYLLIKHEKLRKVINSITKKGVLILGRFGGGGIEVLRAVAEKLRKMGYLPIIFDFNRPRDRNYTETVKTLAGLSSFVVVDLSGPSVPQELTATVPDFKIPFIPIMEKDKQPYAMFVDIMEYDWVIDPIIEFDTIDSLIDMLPSKVVEPATKRLEKRRKRLIKLFGE